jgi:hypothetical protein
MTLLDDKRLFLSSDHLDRPRARQRVFRWILYSSVIGSGGSPSFFLPAIQVFARFFGKIMPIWMPVTLILHLLLLWLTWQLPASHTMFLLSAAILWVIIIVFSTLGPIGQHRVRSYSPAGRREGVPRSAAPRMGRFSGQLVGGAGQ